MVDGTGLATGEESWVRHKILFTKDLRDILAKTILGGAGWEPYRLSPLCKGVGDEGIRAPQKSVFVSGRQKPNSFLTESHGETTNASDVLCVESDFTTRFITVA
jgi:hypothetical protein